MGGGLGAVILAQVLPLEAIALIHQFPVRVGVDRQRAGVDAFRDLQLFHELEHVARPLDVDPFPGAGVPHPDLVPSRDVEHAVHPPHGLAHALLFRDISFVNPHPDLNEILGLAWGTHERNHLVIGISQQSHHPPPDEPGRSCDIVFHF